jgi:hypothetical protein
MMIKSFLDHCHAFSHLHLAISLGLGAFYEHCGAHDHLSFKTKKVSDIILCFLLVNKIRKAIVYNSSLLGGLKPLTQVSTLGLRNQTFYDP